MHACLHLAYSLTCLHGGTVPGAESPLLRVIGLALWTCARTGHGKAMKGQFPRTRSFSVGLCMYWMYQAIVNGCFVSAVRNERKPVHGHSENEKSNFLVVASEIEPHCSKIQVAQLLETEFKSCFKHSNIQTRRAVCSHCCVGWNNKQVLPIHFQLCASEVGRVIEASLCMNNSVAKILSRSSLPP